ncbi:arginine N-succinyltransferase, partial [Mycobacterium tuberculosis]|nr:arginine N-succinyltransferase [Mycobacterium tuberculosis]
PKSEQGYVFVLEESESGAVVGICAIEVAVGLNDPWYNYRVGTQVHASKELNVYQALPTLFLSNDHTGSSELCTLFLDQQWRAWEHTLTSHDALAVDQPLPAHERPAEMPKG